MTLLRMQPQHGRLEAAFGQEFDDAFAATHGLVDRGLLISAWRMQDEVGHVLLELQ